MNRLILIGNGFDLAHGLKTSYRDFIFDLFKKEIENALISPKSNPNPNDDIISSVCIEDYILFQIKTPGHSPIRNKLNTELEKVNDFDDLMDFIQKSNITIEFPKNKIKQAGYIKEYPDTILKKTFENIVKRDYNWVDIERVYYDSLLKIISIKDNNGDRIYSDGIKDQVKLLNNELDFLKERFVKYLNDIMNDFPRDINPHICSHFWSSFKDKFIDREIERLGLKHTENGETFPQEIQILNFNYTNTIERYGDHSFSYKNENAPLGYNYIHGEINKEHNPIIFGYGDETDENYSVMEKLNDNELLRHIKSFGYFKADNYYKLLRFIKSGDYQVCVIGHSCGLSDRVMLKKIFEDDNCKSIQIYYYVREDNSDDYTEKTQEISRHFENKDIMREKIVPKINCFPISNIPLGK